MRTLLTSLLSSVVNEAQSLIRLNSKCIVEDVICDDECDNCYEVSLEVDYNLEHGDPSPDGFPPQVSINDITLVIDGQVVDPNLYNINESDFITY